MSNETSKMTAAEMAAILAPQQTAAEMLPAPGTWTTAAADYAYGVAIREIMDAQIQCAYCQTERGHDYAHPHVVRAANEVAVAAYNRTYSK